MGKLLKKFKTLIKTRQRGLGLVQFYDVDAGHRSLKRVCSELLGVHQVLESVMVGILTTLEIKNCLVGFLVGSASI